MSSQHQYNMAGGGPSGSRAGDIEHLGHLSENIGQLCLSQEYSDVTLIVEGYHIHAHKVVLAARSDYFRALLFGGMREMNQDEVELQGAPLHAFKALLRYVYSGHMALSCLREETVLDTLGLAHQFGFQELETAISEYLRQVLALRNVCAVLDSARLYGLAGLTKVCHNFLDRHASDILKHESFLQLSVEALQELLERNSFFAPEVEIFNAVCNWCNNYIKTNSNRDHAETILRCVRLPLMSLEELLTVVRPFPLVTPDMLLDAIQEKTHTNNTKLKHRGQLLSEENIATPKHGSSVIQGEMRAALLDGDTQSYDMERGYTRHTILEGSDNNGILVKLGVQSIINHIKVLLWDRDLRSYAYYIEVSVDQKDWVRVIDHSNFFCRSWQHLYFEPRVVQYIKLVGTNNTVNKVFHAVSLEALHTSKVPPLYKGLVRPTHNVATLELSAIVVEGVSRSRNALLNGDTQHYDWEYGYTCHQLGSGAILVQLAQPYVLGSIRMLLWDCDDRSYSYYVETSVNYWDWEVVADKSRDTCRSWQVIHFTPHPIVLIKIVGTNNTANEVFHLVHFESPAQEDDIASPVNSAIVAKTNQPIASTNQAASNANGIVNNAVQDEPVPVAEIQPSVAHSDASSDSSGAPTPPPAPLPPTETALEAHESELRVETYTESLDEANHEEPDTLFVPHIVGPDPKTSKEPTIPITGEFLCKPLPNSPINCQLL